MNIELPLLVLKLSGKVKSPLARPAATGRAGPGSSVHGVGVRAGDD